MKRILIFIILMGAFAVLAVPFVFAKGAGEGAEAAEKETVTLRYTHWLDPLMSRMIDRWETDFQKQFPWIDPELEQYPAHYHDKILTEFASGTAPDIMMMYNFEYIGFARRGVWIPLDDYIAGPNGIDKSDILENVVKGYTYEGKMYALPWGVECSAIYYNKEMFDAAGLAYPTKDWTYDDMLDLASKLTIKDKDGYVEQYGFGILEANRFFCNYLWSYGGTHFDENVTKATFNDEIGVQTLQYMVDLVEAGGGLGGPPTQYIVQTGPNDLFTTGQLAMMNGGNWWRLYFEDLPFEYGVVQNPKGPEGSKTWIGSPGWAIISKTEHPDEAWEWIKWITNKANVMELAGWGENKGNTLPAWKSAWTDPKFVPGDKTQVFIDSLPNGSAESFRIDDGITWYWNIFISSLNDALTGNKTPKEALDYAAAETNKIIKDWKGQ